ncbi:MAG: arginine--tRNA ligase, partial [Pirellulaceae bacterium]|nr:arginine--tRNA ligase [Pirellulaceae bacterium]
MSILTELRHSFAESLSLLVEALSREEPEKNLTTEVKVEPLLEMIRPTQDSRFGDYQANCAMPLAKQLGKNPRDLAQKIVDHLGETSLSEITDSLEIAGPGFINIRLKNDYLVARLQEAIKGRKAGVVEVKERRKYVVDFSSPNVAKPMHVGHIRSTVIGDALARILRFLGHAVITDNHLGDWGTQFGMIIYGYKHFVDQGAYRKDPVRELTRLYRKVNLLIEYWNLKDDRERFSAEVKRQEELLREKENRLPAEGKEEKKRQKELRQLAAKLSDMKAEEKLRAKKMEAIEEDQDLLKVAKEHFDIGNA